MNGVTKDTFKGYDTDSKLDTLFDYVHELHEKQCVDPNRCEERFKALERRKWWNPAAAGGGGLIGGFLAFLGSRLWGG